MLLSVDYFYAGTAIESLHGLPVTEGRRTVRIRYENMSKDHCDLLFSRMHASGTHGSFMGLIDGTADIIITDRDISLEEHEYVNYKKVSLLKKPIAKDALIFISNTENAVTGLSMDEIRKIYSGQITNWKEVGGADETIIPLVRSKHSALQGKFETAVMAGQALPEWGACDMGESYLPPYYWIRNIGPSIAFTTFFDWDVAVQTKSTKAMAVDGVYPDYISIRDATYPLLTEIYAFIRSDADENSMVYKLFDYLTSFEGQYIVSVSGYRPLTEIQPVAIHAADASGGVDVVAAGNTVTAAAPIGRISVADANGITEYDARQAGKSISLKGLGPGVHILNIYLEGGHTVRRKIML
jgi:phosphate transport system substrate-binding protein